MSRRSALVVTLRQWNVNLTPVEDADGNIADMARTREFYRDYTYARRDFPRGPEGKREFTATLANAFIYEGLSFAATGNDWAAQIDGPYIRDYATGEEREVSMHFGDGTPAWVVRAVMELVK